MRVRNQSINKATSQSNAGFTLLELMVLLALFGIVSAIASPIWTAFINRQRLNVAQYRVYQAMQEARSQAMLQKVTWQVSFRQVQVSGKPVVEWSLHQATMAPAPASWHDLDTKIHLDNETSLPYSNSVWRARFNLYGCPVYQIDDECGQTSILSKGRLTLNSQQGDKTKRCVIVSTLLGALRTGRENPKKQDGKYYCY